MVHETDFATGILMKPLCIMAIPDERTDPISIIMELCAAISLLPLSNAVLMQKRNRPTPSNCRHFFRQLFEKQSFKVG